MGFITSGPSEALVVSGCCHGQPLIVVGGWAYVIPCIQKVQRLPLCIMTLKVSSPHVYTVQGVPLSVTGIAQVMKYYIGYYTLKFTAILISIAKPCYNLKQIFCR